MAAAAAAAVMHRSKRIPVVTQWEIQRARSGLWGRGVAGSVFPTVHSVHARPVLPSTRAAVPLAPFTYTHVHVRAGQGAHDRWRREWRWWWSFFTADEAAMSNFTSPTPFREMAPPAVVTNFFLPITRVLAASSALLQGTVVE